VSVVSICVFMKASLNVSQESFSCPRCKNLRLLCECQDRLTKTKIKTSIYYFQSDIFEVPYTFWSLLKISSSLKPNHKATEQEKSSE